MPIYEARPKGALTSRHRKELQKAGFGWYGNAWLCRAERLPKVWGCTVRLLRPRQHQVHSEQDWYDWLKTTFGL